MFIIKDKDKKNVTKGAYEQFYKPLGYKPYKVIEAVYTEEIKETKETKIEEPIVENDNKKIEKEKRVTGNKSSNKNKKGE